VISTFLHLLKMEGLQLLRTSEAFTFILLPSVLFTPVVLGVAALILALMPVDHIAVPPEPVGFEVTDLLRASFDVVETDDPEAALARGQVDAAIVSWSLVDPPDPVWLRAKVAGENPNANSRLKDALRKAANKVLDRQIVAAGDNGPRVRVVATIETVETEPGDDDHRPLWVLLYLFGSSCGFILLPTRTAEERQRGLLETIAVAPTPIGIVFLARLVVVTAFCGIVSSLPLVSCWITGILIPWIANFTLLDAIETLAWLLVSNAVIMLIGLVAGSSRTALYNASYGWMFCFAVAATSIALESRFPAFSFVGHSTVLSQLGRIGVLAVLTASVLGAMHAFARHERALPSSMGAE
jgi:hypothetical protein